MVGGTGYHPLHSRSPDVLTSWCYSRHDILHTQRSQTNRDGGATPAWVPLALHMLGGACWRSTHPGSCYGNETCGTVIGLGVFAKRQEAELYTTELQQESAVQAGGASSHTVQLDVVPCSLKCRACVLLGRPRAWLLAVLHLLSETWRQQLDLDACNGVCIGPKDTNYLVMQIGET